MRIWKGLDSIDEPFDETSLAIGTFDGVHIGHQQLISEAVSDSHRHQRPSVIFTFDRHPMELIHPDRFPGYLTTPEQKIKYIESLGCDHMVIARFDSSLRDTDADDFLQKVAHGLMGAKTIYVGEDFRFGRKQAGDVLFLKKRQAVYGYELHARSLVLMNGMKVGSSEIRQLLKVGAILEANEMLSRPYTLAGEVIEGKHLGRTLGYPTANLQRKTAQIIPADGIYATRVRWNGKLWKGAASIGFRPTVGGSERTIETFLLDFDENLYGQNIEVEFFHRLREERHYPTLDLLKAQIARDVEETDRLIDLERDI
jgi:riboflavin kinase/FMN adenylyltransferase